MKNSLSVDTIENPAEWLKAKARDLNVSVSAICREAKISRDTPARWKKGGSPTMYTMKRVFDALEKIEKDRTL